MNLSELFCIAGEGIARNKLRALLIMLGVIIGVSAVIIMIAISAGTEATIAENIQELGTNLLFVTQSMGPQMVSRNSGSSSTFLTSDDAQAISDIQIHQEMCRAAAVSVGTLTGATVRRIMNREGKVEEAAKELAETLME